jgi:hypothetical protein
MSILKTESYFLVLNSVTTVQECDATNVQSGNLSWVHNYSHIYE